MLQTLLVGIHLLVPGAGLPQAAATAVVTEAEVSRVVRDVTLRRPDTLFNFVTATVEGDVVTLTGTVRHQSRGQQIEKEVARLGGVRQVRNQLHAPSTGAGDERLRRELVNGIYGRLGLSRYALLFDPPVRILVERGTVVLAGKVATRVERELLQQVADRSSAFEVVNEVVIDADLGSHPVGGGIIR